MKFAPSKATIFVTSIRQKMPGGPSGPGSALLDPVILFLPERLHFSFRVRRSKKGGPKIHSPECVLGLQR
jgi:hypothetical protein